MCSHMLGDVLAEIARSTCRANFAHQYRHLVLNTDVSFVFSQMDYRFEKKSIFFDYYIEFGRHSPSNAIISKLS